jgi:hypothetical protein
MRNNEIERRKPLLKLTQRQRSILIGTILGDSHFETQNGGRTYRLKVEHSSKQAFYVDWMYKEFQDWTNSSPKSKPKIVKGIKYENYYFQTLSLGQLRFYAKQFYENGNKIVPNQIRHWLTPLALTVWFMDDGSIKSKYHKAIILNTQGFTRKDIQILIDALKYNFEIVANFRKQVDGLQLIIVGSSAELFYKITQPIILPGFEYKFGALVNNLPKEYRRRSKVG